MSLELIEGGIDVIVNYLTSNLPAKVAALNTAYSDSITLPDITAVYDVEQVEQENYPFIEVIGIRSDVLSESQGDLRAAHSIAIMITDAYDQDRSTLRRRVQRYCRGIVELLKAARSDSTFSGYTVVLAGGAIDLLPLRWTRNKSRVIGTAVVGIQVTTMESYP